MFITFANRSRKMVVLLCQLYMKVKGEPGVEGIRRGRGIENDETTRTKHRQWLTMRHVGMSLYTIKLILLLHMLCKLQGLFVD